ncbi:MAG: N-acetylmuramidase domain-containing protein [Candidatus Methylomirabilales bacterium]
MSSPSTYNRRAIGKIWNLMDLPEEWPGYGILLQGDLDRDLVIDEEELNEIDWISFSEAVGDFQKLAGVTSKDSKLGPDTLKRLRDYYGLPLASSGALKQVGDLTFLPAATPGSEPPGPPLVGRTAEERRICHLWNKYGAAIHRQAVRYNISTRVALAVFSVESGRAYDPATGLLIIRFEPHIFKRKAGREIPWGRGGQKKEWENFEQAFKVNGEATLLSTSYGLPQLMGFNWKATRHQSPREMVLAFQDSCEEQVAGFFGFVEKNHLFLHIRNEDWRAFTRRYNGPGNVDVYSGRLMRALHVVDALVQDGADFTA